MVRFIMTYIVFVSKMIQIFTFQYGQIYYENKNIENENLTKDLHSNMVRFIIFALANPDIGIA